ncbi:uncharacterized protein Z519_11778, partial [Cladophialophora bantiana CBS 173.52]
SLIQIRRSLFGDSEFSGKTWDQQIVASNVYYDFHKFGYDDANFIIDKTHWYMASRISTDELWRVTYGEKVATREELLARQPAKWQEMIPGHPTLEQYKIVNFSPYRVHQRLAHAMRVGRFLLSADAAHRSTIAVFRGYRSDLEQPYQTNFRLGSGHNDGDERIPKACKRSETDKAIAKEMMPAINVIKYDFTQHYRNASADGRNE